MATSSILSFPDAQVWQMLGLPGSARPDDFSSLSQSPAESPEGEALPVFLL